MPELNIPSKILVAVDGSDNAHRAFEQAILLAKSRSASLTAIHVIESPPTIYVGSQKVLNDLLEMYRNESEMILTKYEALADKQGLKTEGIIMEGDAASSIVDYAQKGEFDLIVMGSRGLGKLKEMAIGSTSSKVLNHARCPVLIVK